ncbi:hypothetical protein [Kitasatospora sp. NPDC008115]|uniref:hypothetical protein n=1 Tax=Kitasatospora sp. NPDC008115 TaxID=3364022 RepID=UPI0036E8C26D
MLDAFRTGVGRPGEHTATAEGVETAPGAAAQGVPAVVDAARQHRLATLLVQEGGHDPERPVWTGAAPGQLGVRRNDVRAMGFPDPRPAPAADALMCCAVADGADALAVPAAVPGPAGGLGAVLRRRE